MAEAEILLAAASRLNSASHWSKLPVLRQFGWARAAGPGRDQGQKGEDQAPKPAQARQPKRASPSASVPSMCVASSRPYC